PANPSMRPALKTIEETAAYLNVELQQIEARGPNDFDGALAAMAERRGQAFVLAADPFLSSHLGTIAHLAAPRRLPSVGSGGRRGGFGARGRARAGTAATNCGGETRALY